MPRAGEVSSYLTLLAKREREGGERVSPNRKDKKVATSGASDGGKGPTAVWRRGQRTQAFNKKRPSRARSRKAPEGPERLTRPSKGADKAPGPKGSHIAAGRGSVARSRAAINATTSSAASFFVEAMIFDQFRDGF